MPYFDWYSVDAQLNGAWVDITRDVVGEISCGYSIMANGPLDRVAGPGELKILLNNSRGNSAGKRGYYSPNHSNCRAGWKPGIKLRVRFSLDGRVIRKWIGKIPVKEGMKPYTGVLAADKLVEVTARTFIEDMANHTLTEIKMETEKTAAEGLALVLADMPVAPDGTVDYGTMESTFPTIFDTARSNTSALGEVSKLVQSEIGFFYETRSGLVIEGRQTRSAEKTVLDKYPQAKSMLSYLVDSDGNYLNANGKKLLASAGTDAQFTDSQLEMDVSENTNFYNNVRFVAYPRRIDAAATSVLFELSSAMQIKAGESAVISGGYSDPDNKAKSVSCIDAVDVLVAGVHYALNSAKDGSGTDLSADLAISLSWSTGRFAYSVENIGAVDGYIVLLKVIGQGVYLDDPAEFYLQSDASIALYGKSAPLIVDMKYQDDPMVALRWGRIALYQYSALRDHVNSVKYPANRDFKYLSAFLYLEPGDRIRLYEGMTGIGQDFFIQGVQFTIQDDLVFFTWTLRAAAYDVFQPVKWTSDTTPVPGSGSWSDDVYGWDF